MKKDNVRRCKQKGFDELMNEQLLWVYLQMLEQENRDNYSDDIRRFSASIHDNQEWWPRDPLWTRCVLYAYMKFMHSKISTLGASNLAQPIRYLQPTIATWVQFHMVERENGLAQIFL